jgi:hypothetical protein
MAEAERCALSKARGPEPEPLLAVVKQQDKRDTVPGSPLGIVQLPKAKAPRTIMMIGGSLAAVILIGALAWTLSNGSPSRETRFRNITANRTSETSNCHPNDWERYE